MGVKFVFLYLLCVAAAAAVGFLSPVWYLGFIPISFGAGWAAYDLIDVEEPRNGKSPRPPTG
jgi:hypothetical protein